MGQNSSQLPSICPSLPPTPPRGVVIASYLLMAGALLLVMWRGLLPGLLCACVGFLLTRALAGGITRLQRRPQGAMPERWVQNLAAGIIMLAPLLLLTGALTHTRSYIVDAPQQYRELLDYLARTVLELRDKLPHDLTAQLPQGAAEIQHIIANYLANKAGTLAMAGKAWLAGVLHAYVGLLIGALAAVRPRTVPHHPLTQALHRRVTLLGESFRQIVAAQFWIALFNTLLTALFLLIILPVWDLSLPYTPALITLTFVAGMIPIVGNLLCNVVLTVVGLSVSPIAAAACLAFLILIHKAEYVINAKVIGQRTHMAVWELLSVMFVAESVFGPAGLVAAPLFYAYLKKELHDARMI
ncbi:MULTISPECIES: AI-2E family transporter [Comamonas]|uniref:AI-2E family transporter n=1 Tax=Comamonas terrigena TaxID=32013 RepID=A0A2A7UYN1_COMTR|nr:MULTISPECIES: AI-2E family transporter [Comamonas]MBD9532086.1 AI-2E family transporter [Comamonas sp. CMM01]MBV7419956.1 AI-2E family transporter [Comamonas sp. CMM03]MDH0047452.1 AI-2E family transporter [Comamonas terrigena]MDH0509872.1 AI-2E family transporter [Comamonas terrigena]MDH1089749.1 AI-2E family transporter [Comamonas terrigena]